MDADRAAGLRGRRPPQYVCRKQIDRFRQIEVVIVEIALRHSQYTSGNRAALVRRYSHLLNARSIVDKLRADNSGDRRRQLPDPLIAWTMNRFCQRLRI